MYYNYHKHDTESNIRTPDSIVDKTDYVKRAIELGHNAVFTTNHGCSGNVFDTYWLCKENNLKCIFGMECYFWYNRFEQSRHNYHIVIIALNIEGYRELNLINSEANETGFYSVPRVDMDLLMTLTPENVVVTTACIDNPIYMNEYSKEYNPIENYLLPLKNHFGSHFFLEVQNHDSSKQKEWNKQVLKLADEYNIEIIHANDSHYIYPEDAMLREKFLEGKRTIYEDERDFILDYPDEEIIYTRYQKQGVLTKSQVDKALSNTLIFDKAEDLGFTKDIKMPTIYPNLSLSERLNKLIRKIDEAWEEYSTDLTEEEKEYRKKDIEEREIKVIAETNNDVHIADYFLLNKAIIDLGIKYGGVLTPTGRGSAVSFAVNHLLGFTDVDRFEAEVPLYPSRFISSARLLQTRSLPDIDFNMADDKPFIKASKEILGEHSVYRMIAYGKMKESSAFRNLCRAKGLKIEEYNEVAKNLDAYRDNPKWNKLIEESEKYLSTVENVSPSPCSFVMLNGDIRKEIGIMRVNGELCACIDGMTADKNKFLKNDFLIVKVVDINNQAFKSAGLKLPKIKDFKKMIDDDVWKIYENGYTATINQVDSDFATNLVKKYKPKSIAELTSFVAVLRPACESFREEYLTRKPYSTNTEQLDKILESSAHRLIYQENLMAYFSWLGIREDGTYDLIKKIAKKKLNEEELSKLELTLHKNWIKNIGDDLNFEPTWKVVQSSAKYLFNSSHALCVAYDSLYGAYLKAKYPFDYFTSALNCFYDDQKKVIEIEAELRYFNIKIEPIKFGKSKGLCSADKETRSIYKGVGTIKYLNVKIGDMLYKLGQQKFDDFIDVLNVVRPVIDSRQLDILISLSYFSDYGEIGKLQEISQIYSGIYDKTNLKKSAACVLGIPFGLVEKHCQKATDITFMEIRPTELLKEYITAKANWKTQSDDKLISAQLKFVGNIDYINPKRKGEILVMELDLKYSPKAYIYSLSKGTQMTVKIKSALLKSKPIEKGSIIRVMKQERKQKWRKNSEGRFEKIPNEFEWWITEYEKIGGVEL